MLKKATFEYIYSTGAMDSIDEDAKKYGEMYEIFTKFEICGVCGLEGAEMSDISKYNDMIKESGLKELYDERIHYLRRERTIGQVNLFVNDLESYLTDGVLKNSTHVCESCIRYISGKVKSKHESGMLF